MNGLVNATLRYEAMQALAGRWQEITGSGRYWEFSLLMAGVELSGSGYARAYANTGKNETATWTRSGTTITAVTSVDPFLAVTDSVAVEVSSDTGAIPLDDYSVTAVGALSFDFEAIATGATSGTLTFRPKAFWDIESTGSGDSLTYYLLQALRLAFPAASGGDWTFDEMRMHAAGAGGAWRVKLPTLNGEAVTIPDGDQLILPAGTLRLLDLSLGVL